MGIDEVDGWWRWAAKSLFNVLSAQSYISDLFSHDSRGILLHTVYSALVRPVVAKPLARPIAPIAAFHSAGAGEVPWTGSQ